MALTKREREGERKRNMLLKFECIFFCQQTQLDTLKIKIKKNKTIAIFSVLDNYVPYVSMQICYLVSFVCLSESCQYV